MKNTYKSRKKMVRDNFVDEDLTGLSREAIIKKYEALAGDKVRFETEATSAGTYGVNGALINVYQVNNPYNELYATFSLLQRNTTLLSFI